MTDVPQDVVPRLPGHLRDSELRLHALKNQIGIVLGFTELLLQEMDRDDPRRADVEEIGTAAGRAMELLVKRSPSDVEDS